jgi:predicted phosphodiesterase
MNKKRVYKYDAHTGEYVSGYTSIKAASNNMKVNESSIRKALNKVNRTVKGYVWATTKVPNLIESEKELIMESVKLAKKNIRLQDINRIERKTFREYARIENAIAEYNQELNELLKKESMSIKTIQFPEKEESSTVIMQVSDLHLNELVDLPNNHYDFTEASRRLQKYAETTKKVARLTGASSIIAAFTGDILNSDRRKDELLSMATNRSKASIIATKLLTHMILDLNGSGFNITLVAVTGNESRIDPDWGWGDFILSDNYDMAIFNMMKMMLNGKPGIKVVENEDPFEMVIRINGVNILMAHGTSINSDTQKAIQQITGKYANKGILIDYVIFGHIHFANITDLYSRSGSLVGNNIYSDRAINLITKPSQNLHIITAGGEIHNMRVELWRTVGYKGYPIKDDLDAYNAKATSNIHKETTIVKVVI